MNFKFGMCILATSFAAACGGSSSDSADMVVDGMDMDIAMDESLSEIGAEYDRIDLLLNDLSPSFGSVPASGTADYVGAASIDSTSRETASVEYFAYGRATAEVDFDADTITATVTDLYEVTNLDTSIRQNVSDYEGEAIEGTVTINVSLDDEINFNYSGGSTGTLTRLDGTVTSFVTETGAAANLQGDDGEVLSINTFALTDTNSNTVNVFAERQP